MKIKNIIYHSAAMLLLSTSFFSCSDILNENPDSFYEKDNFFTSTANTEMAIKGVLDVFSSTKHYGQYEMAAPCSDDTYYIKGVNSDNTRRDMAHYTVKNTNKWVESLWRYKYMGIDRANFAIAGIQDMSGYEENDVLKKNVAKLRFLRAFLAFDLIKYWGDVPFKTTYSDTYASTFGERIDREVIYDQIIADLDFAKTTLDWADAGTSPEDITQGAARGLLMRVYLQRAGYSLQVDGKNTRPDEALRTTYFTAVTKEWEAFAANGYHHFYTSADNSYLDLFKSYSSGTLNSSESLWEIAFLAVAGGNDAGNWGTYNGPLTDAPKIQTTENSSFMGRANAFFRVVPEWQNFFETQDQRRDVMVCDYQLKWDKALYNHKKKTGIAKKDYYPGKWRREWMPLGFIDPNSTSVNFCPLRYADVVLMAAEAYNEIHNPVEAWRLINSVRQRAKATAIDATNYATFYKAPQVYDLPFIADGDEEGKVRTALYWERGFELAFEGQRKYDLIRWGYMKPALELFYQNTDAGVKKGYPAHENFTVGKHELFPIPLKGIQINSKLLGKNNPGY